MRPHRHQRPAGGQQVLPRLLAGTAPDRPELNRKTIMNIDFTCCGQHEICEKEIYLNQLRNIEYYEDEELDRFRGRTTYSEEEVEEFREVLYTMRTDEVSGWLHSLELRQVNLPDELKDEVLLIVGDLIQ
jgi:hypothetical protein